MIISWPTGEHVWPPLFHPCVCDFTFPIPVYGIPCEYFSWVSLSLSLHLSLFLCCCVAPGDTVMRPPSVPPSLSLCPCHLQLLCETRHSAWGTEAGRVGDTQGGREGREKKRDSFKDRGNKQLVSNERKLNKYTPDVWHDTNGWNKPIMMFAFHPKTCFALELYG